MESDQSASPLKEYRGTVWVGDEPGRRFSLWASDALSAMKAAKAEYGDYPMTLRNEDDSHQIR
jgi:hypothetical protein